MLRYYQQGKMLTDMEVISLHEKNCNSEEK